MVPLFLEEKENDASFELFYGVDQVFPVFAPTSLLRANPSMNTVNEIQINANKKKS